MPACDLDARSSMRRGIDCLRRWISQHSRGRRATARSLAGRPPGIGLPFLADDEARAAAERHVRPRPLDQHRQTLAEAAESIDMYQQPDPPRKVAREPQAPDLRNRAAAADRRELPEVV